MWTPFLRKELLSVAFFLRFRRESFLDPFFGAKRRKDSLGCSRRFAGMRCRKAHVANFCVSHSRGATSRSDVLRTDGVRGRFEAVDAVAYMMRSVLLREPTR